MSDQMLFDFDESQLIPLFTEIFEEAVTGYSLRYEREKKSDYGLMGEYLIPTVTCRTGSGSTFVRTFFVRRQKFVGKGMTQQHHYRYLEQNHIPVPKLYGTLTDDRDCEVMFLEYIDEIIGKNEVFFADDETVVKFFTLIGRLNSLKPDLEYAARLGFTMGSKEFLLEFRTWLMWSIYIIDFIETESINGRMGDSLAALCNTNRQEIVDLKQLALNLAYIISELPTGYVHGDFVPGNTGWRRETGELLALDLEDVHLNTRFFDFAHVAGGWDRNDQYKQTRREVAEIYLSEWNPRTGNNLSVDAFLEEVTLVWFARRLNMWELLPAEMLGAPNYDFGMPGKNMEERLELTRERLALLFECQDTVRTIADRWTNNR